MNKIQVGFLVSYDYDLLKFAIPALYEDSDTIFLAIDKNRKTWKGENFDISPDFFEWIKTYDTNNKIVLFEEEFYISGQTTMECEIRERKMLAEKMGIGNWLIQVDADEYFLDFKSFVKFLKSKNHFLKNPEKNQVQISPFLVNLYKRLDNGMLYVDMATKQLLATNYPSYKVGRQTRKRIIYCKSLILHECLSRTREDLEFKLDNWGHNSDINKTEFLEKWDAVNESNYQSMENFFYLEPEKWPTLGYVKGTTVDEIASNLDLDKVIPSNTFIAMKNFGQWFKFLFK